MDGSTSWKFRARVRWSSPTSLWPDPSSERMREDGPRQPPRGWRLRAAGRRRLELTNILPVPGSDHSNRHDPRGQHQAQGHQGGDEHFGAAAVFCRAGGRVSLVPARDTGGSQEGLAGWFQPVLPPRFTHSLLRIQHPTPPASVLLRSPPRQDKSERWAFPASQDWEMGLNGGPRPGLRRRAETTGQGGVGAPTLKRRTGSLPGTWSPSLRSLASRMFSRWGSPGLSSPAGIYGCSGPTSSILHGAFLCEKPGVQNGFVLDRPGP